MKIYVTRQAICAADDQLNELEMSFDISSDTSLADCVACVERTRFLQFSSTYPQLTGYLADKAVVRLFARSPAEFLVPPDSSIGGTAEVQTLSFRYSPEASA